jgi:hypothetical protein
MPSREAAFRFLGAGKRDSLIDNKKIKSHVNDHDRGVKEIKGLATMAS